MNERNRVAKWLWYAGLIVIYGVILWVPFYNSVQPRLAGIPFFYWFQCAWILVTAIVTAFAYKARL